MEHLFVIIRFPFFLMIIVAITLLAVPIAALGWLVTPVLHFAIWAAYLLSAPIALVWYALQYDKKAMAAHWSEVESGPNLFGHYEAIGNWLTAKYATAYEWLVGD